MKSDKSFLVFDLQLLQLLHGTLRQAQGERVGEFGLKRNGKLQLTYAIKGCIYD